jgi:ParB family chromosome partitioning protein
MTDENKSNPKHRGLGRGLDALFGDEEKGARKIAAQPVDPEDAGNNARTTVNRRTVGTAQLIPNPDQPRRHFTEGALKELADSIREHGIIQPILVRPYKNNEDMYEIIAGERRWRAAQIAQLHQVPVVIREMDDETVYKIALIENLQREDLTAIEEALGYRRLMDDYGHTQEDVAEIIGKSRSHVANMVRLLGLPASVQNMVNDGKLSAGHARALAGVDNPADLAREIVSKGLSVRQAEKLAANAAGRTIKHKVAGIKNAVTGEIEKDHDTLALEKHISDLLGLRTELLQKNNHEGHMMIEYKNLDQLDDIIQRLSNKPDPNNKKWVF